MPNYRRAFVPGGCWFFTVNLLDRRKTLLVDHIETLSAHSTTAPTGGPPGGRCRKVIVKYAPSQEPTAANAT